MFVARFRRRSMVRRRKGERETLQEDAARFKNLVVLKIQEKGLDVPSRLLKELQRASQLRDVGQRLYKLDLHRAKLTDAHVEVLADALRELPVLRKLDLRGNGLTDQAVRAMNAVLKIQVELFRLVQADANVADSHLSFLYSIKFDAAVLALDRKGAEELEAHVAALEVADSVLDVRHAFFQADIRETGNLTEHELGDAMRIVMGTMPKASDMARVLRFFGQRGADGKPPLIDLGGFEAAMAGRLRETHTIPLLTRGRDDLLFGPTNAVGNHGYKSSSECFSPWSTRSFRITDTKDLDQGTESKRSPSTKSPGLQRSAGTHVFFSRPWNDGEAAGTELSNTLECGGVDVSAMDWSASHAAREGGRSKTPDGRSNSGTSFLDNRRERSFSKGVWRRNSLEIAEQRAKDKDADDYVMDQRKERNKVEITTKGESSTESMSSAVMAETVLQLRAISGGGKQLKELQEGSSNDEDRSSSNVAESHARPAGTTRGGNRSIIKSMYEDEHEPIVAEAELSQGDTSSSQENDRSTMFKTKVVHREDSGVDQTKHTGLQSHRDDRPYAATEVDSGKKDHKWGNVEGSAGAGGSGVTFELADGGRARRHSGPRGRQAEKHENGDASGNGSVGKESVVIGDSSGRPCATQAPGAYGYSKGQVGSLEPAKHSSENWQMATTEEKEKERRHGAALTYIHAMEQPNKIAVLPHTPQDEEQQTDATAVAKPEAVKAEPASTNAPSATSSLDAIEGTIKAEAIAAVSAVASLLGSTSSADVNPAVDVAGAEVMENGNQLIPNPTANLALGPATPRSVLLPTADSIRTAATGFPAGGDPVVTAMCPPESQDSSVIPVALVGSSKTPGEFIKESNEPAAVTMTVAAVGDKICYKEVASIAQAGPGMPTPWCLAPANVAARAREHPAGMHEERQRLTARIDFASGLSDLSKGCTDIKHTLGEGEGVTRHAGGCKATSPKLSNVSGATRSWELSFPATSPNTREVLSREDGNKSRKDTAHDIRSVGNMYGAWSYAGGSESSFGRVTERKEEMDGRGTRTDSSRGGFLHPEEEQPLEVRLKEGALIMSRNGLGHMAVALELEATYGCGRDTLLALHTLVLSCNQLKVLEYSVLATMPALRHLDVSHNLLCRMEPTDGHELSALLETLNMSNNRISRISGISHCDALRVLNLSHNKIKSTLGLEHLSLLEQLDLGHNLISKAVSVRALSFNRSLKLLWLEGNPFAADPRYRPTLICLLPHVRAIDRKGMPRSSTSERRSLSDSRELTKERGVHAVSREVQEEHDVRRSNDWRQTVAWREENARRENEANEQRARERHLQPVNPVQQRQLVEQLARPHSRGRLSESAISRAKDVARRRCTIAFGVTYRQPMENTRRSRTAGTSPASSRRQRNHQERILMGKPHGKSGDGEGGVILSSMAPRISREGNAAGDVENGPRSHRDRLGLLIPGGERVVTPEFPIVSTDTSGARNCTGTVAGSETYEAGSFLSSYSVAIDSQNARAMHFNDEPPQRNHRQLVVDQVAERTRDVAMVVSDPVREVTGDAHVSVIPAISSLGISPAERGPAIENEISVPLTPSQRNALEKWLKDVAQETETAATALQVLLKMHREPGKDGSGSRRLANFRAALEGMALFAEHHGAPPDFVGEEGAHADSVLTATRRVAVIKAAVKNMLRLMEAEPAGSPALDQYAEFLLQQDEIIMGDRTSKHGAMIDSRNGDVLSNVEKSEKSRDGIDASTYTCISGPDISIGFSGIRQPIKGEPKYPADDVKVSRSTDTVDECFAPESDMRRSSIGSERTSAQGSLGSDFTNFNSVGENIRCLDYGERPGESNTGKSAKTVSVAAGVSNRVVSGNNMRPEPTWTIATQATGLLALKKGVEVKEGCQGKIATAHANKMESHATPAGRGLDITGAFRGNRSTDSDPNMKCTVTGVADEDEAKVDLRHPNAISSLSKIDHGLHDALAPTVPGLSSGIVVDTALTTADSVVLPSETCSKPPPLATATAIAALEAEANATKEQDKLVGPEDLSSEDRKLSQQVANMSPNISPNPVTRLGICKEGIIGDSPLVAAGNYVANIGVSPATAIINAYTTGKASSFANQCPGCNDTEDPTATNTLAVDLGSSHFSTRERLLRRVRTSMGGPGSLSASDSDCNEANDPKEHETDRLNGSQDASARGNNKDEEKEHQHLPDNVAGQPNEQRNAMDAALNHDLISSNNESTLSACQYIQHIGVDIVAANSTGVEGGEASSDLPLTTPYRLLQNICPPNVSQDGGEGEGMPSIENAGVVDHTSATHNQRVKRERDFCQTSEDDFHLPNNRRLDDDPGNVDRISGPTARLDNDCIKGTSASDEGVRTKSEAEELGGNNNKHVGEGTVTENEDASLKMGMVQVGDGSSDRDDHNPTASTRDLPTEAKVGATRSVKEDNQAREEGKVKTAIDSEGKVPVDTTVEQGGVNFVEPEPQWIEGYDRSHDYYYYHHVATGESSWYKPDAPYEAYVHSDEDDDVVGVGEEKAIKERGDRKEKVEPHLATKGVVNHQPSRNERTTSGKEDVEVRANGKNSGGTLQRAGHHRDQHKSSSTASRARRRKLSPSPTAGSRRRSSVESEHAFSLSRSESSCSTSRNSNASRVRTARRSGKKDSRRGDDGWSRGKSAARGEATKTRSGHIYRRQSAKKSALDQLENLTDENISGSDRNVSDVERRDWRRKDRRHRDADGKRASNARRSSSDDYNRVGRGRSPGRTHGGVRHREIGGASSWRGSNVGNTSRKYSSSAIRRNRDRNRGTSFSEDDSSGSRWESTSNHGRSHRAGRVSETRRTSSRKS